MLPAFAFRLLVFVPFLSLSLATDCSLCSPGYEYSNGICKDSLGKLLPCVPCSHGSFSSDWSITCTPCRSCDTCDSYSGQCFKSAHEAEDAPEEGNESVPDLSTISGLNITLIVVAAVLLPLIALLAFIIIIRRVGIIKNRQHADHYSTLHPVTTIHEIPLEEVAFLPGRPDIEFDIPLGADPIPEAESPPPPQNYLPLSIDNVEGHPTTENQNTVTGLGDGLAVPQNSPSNTQFEDTSYSSSSSLGQNQERVHEPYVCTTETVPVPESDGHSDAN